MENEGRKNGKIFWENKGTIEGGKKEGRKEEAGKKKEKRKMRN